MIDKLLELHGIRYVISVDDCYSNITEMEIKAALLSEMNNSFLNFREEISKMGKKELLNNIEQMIEFSGEKEALIRDFLENFSKEQLLELYGLIPQEQSNKYTTEKERLIGFLDKLKQENLVDGYEVCMSTTEALKIDYEAKGQKFDSILWLIDRSFERVGESSEAGLQLARTIVGRSDGPTNYVYILSALAKDEGKTEEEIEAARWSIVLENNMGVYAYDMDSLHFEEVKNGVVDKNIVNVFVKTVFTDKDLLKKMNKTYAEKLAKKEKVQYCEMLMQFNVASKTYGVKQMEVYGSKGTKLESKINNGELVPVPEKTFAEAMLEICTQAVKNTDDTVNNK